MNTVLNIWVMHNTQNVSFSRYIAAKLPKPLSILFGFLIPKINPTFGENKWLLY